MNFWCNQCEEQREVSICGECGCKCVTDQGYRKGAPFYHAHSFGMTSAFADEVRRYAGTEFEPDDKGGEV